MSSLISDAERAAVSVDRAITELRRGRPVRLSSVSAPALLCAARETADAALIDRYLSAAGVDGPRLLISAERARALGYGGDVALALRPPRERFDERTRALGLDAEPTPAATDIAAGPVGPGELAALRLAVHARLLPALLTLPWRDALDGYFDALAVDAGAVDGFSNARAAGVVQVSAASVQLDVCEDSYFVLFRGADGAAEHLAVIVASPELDAPVLTRVHSACLTGDLFASLRCDCGEQLHKAVAALAAAGGGVLLYLAQEGRNIGLASKLRAYALQQRGLDTVRADAQLGFGPDQRYYDVAAAMLRALGVGRVRLLTNNPGKLAALAAHGVEIVERVPLTASPNSHNRDYLATKKKLGHLL